MRALESLGCQIVPYDVGEPARQSSWWRQQLGYRLSRGPLPARVNEDILRLARQSAELRYVWIDKGLWIYPETLRELRAMTGARLVHYTPDPQVSYQKEKLHYFHRAVQLYDLLVTTKPFELEGYARLGARSVLLTDQSYDDHEHQPRTLSAEQRERFGSEVCFVGQYTEHYAALLDVAVSTGAKVRLWGPQWRKHARQPWVPAVLAGDGLWDESYSRALSGAAIVLCFLSKRYPETTTTRTFEIPACGAFMLAERTADHQRLFTEGVEAEFFGDEVELADKIRFYLANPQARMRIAAAGRERCLRSGYGNRARMQSLLAAVDAVKTQPVAA